VGGFNLKKFPASAGDFNMRKVSRQDERAISTCDLTTSTSPALCIIHHHAFQPITESPITDHR
jgi:hypothetical protein